MTRNRMTDEELAAEARRWRSGEASPHDWFEVPEGVVRAKESVPISIRLPVTMLAILKEFARREGIGYQVLMKRWLDDRISTERQRLRQKAGRSRRAGATNRP